MIVLLVRSWLSRNAPNTELKYVFDTDEDGNEYENLVQSQNIEEIVLCVKKVGSSEETSLGLTEITPSSFELQFDIFRQ